MDLIFSQYVNVAGDHLKVVLLGMQQDELSAGCSYLLHNLQLWVLFQMHLQLWVF